MTTRPAGPRGMPSPAAIDLLPCRRVRHADPRQYRPDIDGLRAVAVVPVVLFHAKLSALSGGYVGVDVFFVISGFLITRLIATEIADGRFSLLRFYERRVRRIWPAFLAVVAATALVGSALLMPTALVDLAHSVLASVLFASNILFFQQADYWDAPAHAKPLLHTWSLSVEEQFYIVFPLLLLGLFRWQRAWSRKVHVVLAALALLSLVACVVATGIAPGDDSDARAAAFYLAPFRAWELLVGALLALNAVPPVRVPVAREAMTVGGLVAIGLAMVVFDEHTPFPGATALIPVLGTALVIHAGGDTRAGRALGAAPMVFVGALSYSLYLWHWPCLVFAGLWMSEPLSTTQAMGAVGVSCVLAVLSWRFIESPFRDRVICGSRRALFAGAAAGTIVVVAFVVAVHVGRGFPARMTAEVNALARARKDSNPDRKRCHASDKRPIVLGNACRYGVLQAEPTLAIWGDSFAAELAVALGHEASRRGSALLYVSHSACPPALGLFDDRPVCARHNRDVLAGLSTQPRLNTVVLVARYEAYTALFGDAKFFAGFGGVVDALVAAGKRVVVVYPIPQPHGPVPALLATRAHRGGDPHEVVIARARYARDFAVARVALDQIVARHASNVGRVVPAHPADLLCDAARCALMLDDDVLYFDDHHLSLRGAERVLPALLPAFTP